jgi:hypothetical protein
MPQIAWAWLHSGPPSLRWCLFDARRSTFIEVDPLPILSRSIEHKQPPPTNAPGVVHLLFEQGLEYIAPLMHLGPRWLRHSVTWATRVVRDFCSFVFAQLYHVCVVLWHIMYRLSVPEPVTQPVNWQPGDLFLSFALTPTTPKQPELFSALREQGVRCVALVSARPEELLLPGYRRRLADVLWSAECVLAHNAERKAEIDHYCQEACLLPQAVMVLDGEEPAEQLKQLLHQRFGVEYESQQAGVSSASAPDVLLSSAIQTRGPGSSRCAGAGLAQSRG